MPNNESEQAIQLREEMLALLPDRCKKCGHYAVGLSRVIEDVTSGRMTFDAAQAEVQEAAKDIDQKCQLGLVASTAFTGMYVCSYGIDPQRLAEDYTPNEYFTIRFEL